MVRISAVVVVLIGIQLALAPAASADGRSAKTKTGPASIQILTAKGLTEPIQVLRQTSSFMLVKLPKSVGVEALPLIARQARTVAVAETSKGLHLSALSGDETINVAKVTSTRRGVVVEAEPGGDFGAVAEALPWFARALGKRVSLVHTFFNSGFVRGLPDGTRVAMPGKAHP